MERNLRRENKDVFEYLENILKIKDKNFKIDDRLETCFERYKDEYSNIKGINGIIDYKIEEICRKCSKIFRIDDMNLRITHMVGFFQANAFVTPFDGGTAFYFLEKLGDKRTIGIILAHEITHMFHFSKLPKEKMPHTLAHNIFIEGLACVTSRRLFQGFHISDYMYIQNDCWKSWSVDCIAKEDKIKRDAIQDIDSSGKETYLKYFVKDSNIDSDMPDRVGYLIGYIVVDNLTKKYSLEEMVRWSPVRITEEVRSVLGTMNIKKIFDENKSI